MKKISITEEDLRQWYCYDNLSDYKIAEKLGCAPTTILLYRRKWNIKKLYKDKEWLNEQYNVKKRKLQDITAEINCGKDTVSLALRKFGFVVRRDRRSAKHTINERIFERIDTPEKAYWLGFITADGCITDDKKDRKAGYTYHYHRLSFILSRKDRCLLEAFRHFISAETIPIKNIEVFVRGKKYLQSSIRIASNLMARDLMAHGVVPRKSTKENPPIDIPDYLIRHFIRGEFDGDGCVTYSKEVRVTIVGSRKLMCWLKDQIGFGYIHRDKKSSELYSYNIYSRNECLQFYHKIYEGATIYLERKESVFHHIPGLNVEDIVRSPIEISESQAEMT